MTYKSGRGRKAGKSQEGRKKVSLPFSRVSVTIRLPRWLRDRIRADFPRGAGQVIEDAVKQVHGYEPEE